MIADAVEAVYAEKHGTTPCRVAVDVQSIRLTDRKRGQRFVYLTPRVAQRALVQFDQGITPTEFTFRLQSGQVIPIKQKKNKPRSEAQRAHAKKIADKARRRAAAAKLHVSGKSAKHTGAVEINKIGGKAPPRAALSGNRRQFGLKSLGDITGPTQ